MPNRRPTGPPRATCVVLAALLALGGCSLIEEAAGPGAREGRTSTAPPSGTAPPSAEGTAPAGKPALRTSTITVGDVSLRLGAKDAATVEADAQGAGTSTVTLELAPGSAARLALTSPGALDVDSDGSITVLDGNGTPVAAVGPPATSAVAEGVSDDAVPAVEVTGTDATRARLEVDDRRPRSGGGTPSADPGESGPVRVTFVVGTQAVDGATWGENEGGRSLAVDPADWARHAGEAGLDLIRTQLVAVEPEAGSSTMDDQLVCHAVGAPDKDTWNLEPWRPDVGLILTAAAHCNPV